jgi:hypothetical protein
LKVFWSWQSDTPGKTGRHLIRQALADAIETLKQPAEVEEPNERDSKEALHLDQDRQGVPGSPDLARTILDKIEASSVFVADVTPVSVIPARKEGRAELPEKRNMNPNVAIELGYALKALTDHNVLMVLNTHYGGRNFLPFDLAHKAGPILFELSPGATTAQRREATHALRSQLITALRPYVRTQTTAVVVSPFKETRSTLSAAAYFKAGESLAQVGVGDDRVSWSYTDGRGLYLRLIPQAALPQPFTNKELLDTLHRAHLLPLWPNFSALYGTNAYGAIVLEPPSRKSGTPNASTQVFANGEVWALTRWLLEEGRRGRFISALSFERLFRLRLEEYVGYVHNELGITPPYLVEIGGVGLAGFRILVNHDAERAYGPIAEDLFQVRRLLNEATPAALDQLVLAASEELFRTSGYPRPKGPVPRVVSY